VALVFGLEHGHEPAHEALAVEPVAARAGVLQYCILVLGLLAGLFFVHFSFSLLACGYSLSCN
jgi:hypothetical protein